MTSSIFDQTHVDQLKEITNIGAGNAGTALSHMLGKKVEMTVPESFVGDLTKIEHIFGSRTEIVVAIFLKMYGDVDGSMLMIFSPDDALKFVNLLTGNKHGSMADLDEAGRSTLTELGNILLGASISALSKFLSINISHTIPDQAIDMLGAIMDNVLVGIGNTTEEILAFKVRLSLVDENLSGELFYFFDANSTTKIFEFVNRKISN